jgi:hypothetical protein
MAATLYQARWEESVYNNHGSPVERFTMTGILPWRLNRQRTKPLFQNPLGFTSQIFNGTGSYRIAYELHLKCSDISYAHSIPQSYVIADSTTSSEIILRHF